jgi:phosphoribosylformylglycinamidine (FGAM) synthase PurS component
MAKVELFVGLKIPDTTAITTFHTLKMMGFDIKKLKRQIYYKFNIDGDSDKFAKKVNKVDVLVNANKNTFSNELKKEEGAIYVLAKDRGDKCEGLLSTLKYRLGLKEIKSMEKGILWALYVDSEELAKEIAQKLLYNENYQEIEFKK